MSETPVWKKAAVTAVGGAVLVVGSIAFAGNYLYNFALNNKHKKGLAGDKEKQMDIGDSEDLLTKKQRENRQWVLERKKDMFIISEDHLILHGYRISAEEDQKKYAIICHGYKSRGWNMGAEAKAFYERGWNVILPDARSHGESDGKSVGMGWPERRDICCWIERILKEVPDAKILLFGFSMGAATVMMTSGEELPPQVKGIIEDCGYTSVWDEFGHQLKAMFHLPKFPVLPMASVITRLRASYSFKKASALEQVKKCDRPILFIHGEEDTFVPYAMLDELYEAANEPKEKLSVAGAGHGLSSIVAPELYWNTIDEFLEEYI